MPLGSAVKSTINIDFTRAQGTNSTGKILFQPPRVVVGTTVLSTRAVVAEVADGVGTIELVRLPAGTYHVTETIDNQEPYEWDFSLPLTAPATIEYETIAAVSPVPAIYTAVRTINGVPPDPTTGNIEIAGGGGPSTLDGLSDVTIVTPANGHSLVFDTADSRWENRALTAGDVGASPTGHTHTVAQITDFLTAVDARVQLIVDAAPAALDTLNELAAALGDDPNFAGTITLALAGKQPLSTDLTEIAGLLPANNDLLQQIAGAWAVRTPAQVKTSLALVKADVGLSSVTDTAQVPLSLFDAAGDLVVGSADNTAVRLAKGADGTFLGVSGGNLGYFTPAGGGGTGDLELYPPTAAGFKEWTADPQVCSADFNHNGGVLLVMRMRWRQPSGNLSEIGFCVTSGASGPGAYSGVALYEDGVGVVNKLGESLDAGALWTTQGPKSAALVTPVAVTEGDFYRVAVLWNGTGAGKIAGVPAVILDSLMNAGVRRSVYLTGQATFPATINVATANTNNATYWMSAK